MNDDVVPPADPTLSQADPTGSPVAPVTPDPGDKRSPLEVLQEILEDAKSAQAARSGDKADGLPRPEGGGSGSSQSPAKDGEDASSELSEEIQQQIAQQAELDKIKLKEEIAKFQDVYSSPQNQARMEQKATEEQKRQEKQDSEDGFQIEQIKHTKI